MLLILGTPIHKIVLDPLICNRNCFHVTCLSRSPDHVNCSVLCLVGGGHFISDIFTGSDVLRTGKVELSFCLRGAVIGG